MTKLRAIHSLGFKLTLAFVMVSLIGFVVMALAFQIQARQRFNEFVLDAFQSEFVTDLVAYYEAHGSWDDLHKVFQPQLGFPRTPSSTNRRAVPMVVTDTDSKVVYGGPDLLGQTIDLGSHRSMAIRLDGQIIGWVVLFTTDEPFLPGSPERTFLDNLTRSILISALIASMLALLLGILLARTIARPIRELTAATRSVANGNLGYQVRISSRDELGQLGEAFNLMSADLGRSVELRRQMTADVAHELRTPLSIILGYTEALNDRKLRGSPEVFEVMHSEAQHLQRLIEDLRTLSLADAGELTLMYQLVSPGTLLTRVAAAHQEVAQEKKIAIELDLNPDLPKLQIDPDRIAQVLSNLITNALRFTPEGGRVRLTAARKGAEIMLGVTDDGIGIEPENLPYIFERFYKADHSRQGGLGESGLGLAIARSIVQAHGGTITVESSPGKGSTFTIKLPVDESASKAPLETPA